VLARTGSESGGGGWRAEALAEVASSEEASRHLMQVQARRDCLWVGLPGTDVLPSEQGDVRDFLVKEHKCLPVLIGAVKSVQYSSGFCDHILWPLFHSATPTTDEIINNHAFAPPNDDDGFDDNDTDNAGWSGGGSWSDNGGSGGCGGGGCGAMGRG
jgi:hypothetical protein